VGLNELVEIVVGLGEGRERGRERGEAKVSQKPPNLLANQIPHFIKEIIFFSQSV